MNNKKRLSVIILFFLFFISIKSFSEPQNSSEKEKNIGGVPLADLQNTESETLDSSKLSQPIINQDDQPETTHWFKGKFREFRDKSKELFSDLKERFAIGTRSEYFKLKTEKDDFIGSIDYLKAEQDYDPDRLFLDVNLTEFSGIRLDLEFTWTKLEMGTITTYANDQNDGNLQLKGPVFLLNASYRNLGRFVPYAGIGAVYFNKTDVSEGWWHYGFTPPENGDWRDSEREFQAWRQGGSPAWPNNGFTRTFELDNTWGYILNAGCDIHIYKSLIANINFRYTDAVVDNTYYLSFYGHPVDTRHSEFDISNYTFGIGIKYQI